LFPPRMFKGVAIRAVRPLAAAVARPLRQATGAAACCPRGLPRTSCFAQSSFALSRLRLPAAAAVQPLSALPSAGAVLQICAGTVLKIKEDNCNVKAAAGLAFVLDRMEMGMFQGRRLCATPAVLRAALVEIQPRGVGLGRVQVRGMSKGKKVATTKSKASPVKAKIASSGRVEEAGDTLPKAGVITVVFECPSPMQFTALSSFALLQIAGWVWMIGSNVLGYSMGSTFIVSNWWCSFGLALSAAMATMTYWHASHHLVRLAVKP
jgi:hypothetical protein